MNKVTNIKPETFNLWWFDEEQNQHFPGGVAFYDEYYGEYRLKVDMYPDNLYYVRPINSVDEIVNYRVEVVIKKDGKFHNRKPIGTAFSSKATNDDIVMTLAPYKKKLILGVKKS